VVPPPTQESSAGDVRLGFTFLVITYSITDPSDSPPDHTPDPFVVDEDASETRMTPFYDGVTTTGKGVSHRLDIHRRGTVWFCMIAAAD
jgi:hypothetical protein